jgi:hypothetical protein
VVGVLREVLANERLMARLRRGLGCRDYTIWLEVLEGATFIHSSVSRWSPAVAVAMRRDMDAIGALHDGQIYATQTEHPHGDDCDKWRKFVCMMGFRFHTTVGAKPGHSVYVRRG